MAVDDRDFIRENARRVEEWENTPRHFKDPYADMTSEEKSKLIVLLQKMIADKDEDRRQLNEKLDALIKGQEESGKKETELILMIKSLNSEISQLRKERDAYKIRIDNLEADLKKNVRERFGAKSQQSKKKPAKSEQKSREKDKDDFDGNAGSCDYAATEDKAGQDSDEKSNPKKERTPAQLAADLWRRGTTKKKSYADNTVTHESDESRLPGGAELIGYEERYAYDQKVVTTEHVYRLLKYRLNGKMYSEWLPAQGEPDVMDKVPGTHASASLLTRLASDRYHMDTPLYRENQKLGDEGLHIQNRKTLTDWLHKGARFLKPVADLLTSRQLKEDSIINCDETWQRVKVEDTYRKRYVWCMVNKKEKIVTYHYEDGSRSREALKSILGESKPKAIQTDGYNAYHYLDADDSQIDHLCCMAHARAKFKYAADAGDPDAQYMLDRINRLYILETKYVEMKFSGQQVKEARGYESYLEIMGELRSKLDALKAPDHPPRCELTDKALNYMDTFWTQLFRYRENGDYCIDNSIAERNIRPLAGERKNTLFFGSNKMAEASAIYHSIIATCKMLGVSFVEYLNEFFTRIIKGDRNYEGLLPQNIFLSANNI